MIIIYIYIVFITYDVLYYEKFLNQNMNLQESFAGKIMREGKNLSFLKINCIKFDYLVPFWVSFVEQSFVLTVTLSFELLTNPWLREMESAAATCDTFEGRLA